MKEQKPLPIGIDNFEKLIQKGCYYVDKTLLIRDLLDKVSDVSLFTRPRRFGKTLSLSMIQYFFEDARDLEGSKLDYRHLFDGLNIMQAGEKYLEEMGQYPVIHLSLKAARQPDFETTYVMLRRQIADEYKRHVFILKDRRMESGRERYQRIMEEKAERSDYNDSLRFLSQCLELYYGKKVIILIDEYDVPLENAYIRDFYNEVVDFMRSLLESALKTNDSLEFAVMTGCLRISKESIFTGLNNLEIISILNPNFGEYFGFTLRETVKILEDYGIADKQEEIKTWYDGYLFGLSEVYNPWSVVNYVKNICADKSYGPKAYWSNTSSNSIVRDLIERADPSTRMEIEELIAGGTIEKCAHEEITYDDIDTTQDNLWNFLFFTGYLKKISERMINGDIVLKLAIPNEEVRYIYRNTILTWFDRKIQGMDMTQLMDAIERGDCERISSFVSGQLMDTISFYDYKEDYYHGFLTGLLKCQKKYAVVSNRESGEGRYDIALRENRFRGDAYILEMKTAGCIEEMQEKCEAALQQIDEKKYEAGLINDGYVIKGKFGFSFYKKGCMVIKGRQA